MARGGFPGGFGGGNINNLMKQAQKLQRDMEQAQKELDDIMRLCAMLKAE